MDDAAFLEDLEKYADSLPENLGDEHLDLGGKDGSVPVKISRRKAADNFTRSNRPSPVSDVRAALKEAKKPKMRTVQHYLCDGCDGPIMNPRQGYIIHGNIYVADASCRGGLIGNNFPDVKPGDKIEVGDVKENVFCQRCLRKILNLDSSTPRAKPYADKFAGGYGVPKAARREDRPMANYGSGLTNMEEDPPPF